jgi:hypothetical protein
MEVKVHVSCSNLTEEIEGVFTLYIETKKTKLRYFVLYRITPLDVWKKRLEWLDVLQDRLLPPEENNNNSTNESPAIKKEESSSLNNSNSSFSTTSYEPHPALLLLSKDVDFTFLRDYVRVDSIIKQENRTIQLIEELNRKQKLIPVLYYVMKVELKGKFIL